ANDGSVRIDQVAVTDATDMTLDRTSQPPAIDGKLDDAVWKQASPLAGFWASNKTTHQASLLTTAWMSYDDENLYIAIRNDEPHMDQLKAEVTERDGPVWNDDCNEIFIMPPEGDGAHLAINSANTQADLSMVRAATGDITQDQSWDGQWQSAVSKTDD